MGAGDTGTSAVGVWRRAWLAPSETFILNQVNAYRSWRPLRYGLQHVVGGLTPPPEFFLPETPRGRVQRRRFEVSRRSRALTDRMRTDGVRVVHGHFGYDASLVQKVAATLDVPLVVTFHGHDVTSLPREDHWRARLYRHRLPDLFRAASTLLCVSGFIRDELLQLGADPAKARVHYTGIPVPPEPKPEVTRTGVVFVGRLVDKKGVFDLLEAMARVDHAIRERTPLMIVGDGPLRPMLEEMASGFGLRACFTGRQSPSQVMRHLGSAAVFAGPSKRAPSGDAEGLGMVFLEAAAAGLPVIGYAHGGVSEAVIHGETGLLVPEGDIDALAEALESVLTDGALAGQLGAAGRRLVQRRFDINTQTHLLESMYDKLIRDQ